MTRAPDRKDDASRADMVVAARTAIASGRPQELYALNLEVTGAYIEAVRSNSVAQLNGLTDSIILITRSHEAQASPPEESATYIGRWRLMGDLAYSMAVSLSHVDTDSNFEILSGALAQVRLLYCLQTQSEETNSTDYVGGLIQEVQEMLIDELYRRETAAQSLRFRLGIVTMRLYEIDLELVRDYPDVAAAARQSRELIFDFLRVGYNKGKVDPTLR